MANRDTPYGAFNFTVSFDGGETFGGFSDVSGIGTELTVAEYRNGNEKENHVRKVPGVHKVSDVTLKRGIVDSKSVFDWIKETRTTGVNAKKKSVTITLHDEAQTKVQSWILANVINTPDRRWRRRAAATWRWKSSCSPPRAWSSKSRLPCPSSSTPLASASRRRRSARISRALSATSARAMLPCPGR
jgi:phage tail-like protein